MACCIGGAKAAAAPWDGREVRFARREGDTLRWVGGKWNMTEGYGGDPKLSTLFPIELPICPDEGKTYGVDGPIRFTDLCEHHVLPIFGSAWVGYLAVETLIGIPKTLAVAAYASAARQANSVAQTHAAFPGQDLNPLLVENNLVQQRIPRFKHPGGIAVLGEQLIQTP